MPLVGGSVREVVEQVNRSGKAAEDRESRRRCGQRLEVQQTAAEQRAREDDQVLRPLFGRSDAASSAGTEREGAPGSGAACGRKAGDRGTGALTAPSAIPVCWTRSPGGRRP